MATTAVKERPILFSAQMVRALLEGRKTQTRRIVKPQPSPVHHRIVEASVVDGFIHWRDDQGQAHEGGKPCPYGRVGDCLWVREAFAYVDDRDHDKGVLYRADDWGAEEEHACWPWRPSIHLPRHWSRITLEITEVRVQRVQEISYGDAVAEGAPEVPEIGPTQWFSAMWELINGTGSWNTNPWVWALTFKVL